MKRMTIFKSYLKSVWIACCILGLSVNAFALPVDKVESLPGVPQSTITVTGIVKDALGEELPGVNIVEKGTTNGTMSDYNGKFQLTVAGTNSVLQFSYVGFVSQDVTIGNRTSLTITLQDDSKLIDEVVVIGYGTQKKGDVTSAIASVKSDSFVKGAVQDAGQLVQGKVAGLNITLPSGDPTSETQIMLRGVSSLKGGSTPLVLVDGVPGSLNTVAPEDIESIDVLKDGSATAIYGTRGTNGVIIITTKGSQREMPNTIEYAGYLSVAHTLKKPDFMKAEDIREKWAQGYTYEGANIQDFGGNTDWLDEITRTGFTHVHNISLRGGSKQTSYNASVNYRDREGTFIESDFKSLMGRFEITHSMFNNKLIANASGIMSEHNMKNSFNNYAYRAALIRNPTEPIQNEDGTWFERNIYVYDNPIGYIKETHGERTRKNMRYTAGLTFRPIEYLTLKAMYTRKNYSNMNGYYQTKQHVSNTKNKKNGYAYRRTDEFRGNFAELTASWQQVIDKHSFSALVGYNYEDNATQWFSMDNYDFPTDAYDYHKMEAGLALSRGEATMKSYKYDDKLIGMFARLTYAFDDKYLFMFSMRREGSSKFGSDHKWGTFPGVSIGWKMDKEQFMAGQSWLDNLKLRAGFGITGINVADPYTSLSSLNYEGAFLYNGSWAKELKYVRNANPDLRWEKKHEYNVGLDWDIFKGRVGGSMDYYVRLTKDALWDYSVPTPPYLYGTMLANAAELRNNGFEFLIRATPVDTRNWEWNTNVSYSTNKNKLLSLQNEQFQMTNDFDYQGHTGEPIQVTTHIAKVGEPIGTFFGLKSVGVSDDGKWLVESKDGEVILASDASSADWQVLGNGIPKHYLNWNNTVRFKNLDVSINMRGAFGFEILNFQRMYYENKNMQYNTLRTAYDLVYGKELNDSQRYVSHYIEKGNYWKIDNVTLGYTFNLGRQNVIKHFRIYGSVLNLATITGYKGLDPEVPLSSTDYGLLDAGTDHRDKYPTVRSYTFGVNLTF